MLVLTWNQDDYKESSAQMAQVAARLQTRPLVMDEKVFLKFQFLRFSKIF